MNNFHKFLAITIILQNLNVTVFLSQTLLMKIETSQWHNMLYDFNESF